MVLADLFKHRTRLRTGGTTLLVLLFVLFSPEGWPQPPENRVVPTSENPLLVQTQLEPKEGRVGDVYTYQCTVFSFPDTQYELPEVGELLKDFEILSFDSSKTTDESTGVATENIVYQITRFETGTVEIPSLEVRYWVGEDERTVQSSPLSLVVNSVLPPDEEELDIQDIKGPVPVPLNLRPYILGTLAALLILAIVAVLATWIAKWWMGREKTPEIIAEVEPAYEQALRMLRELKEKDLPGQGLIDEYYVRLSGIVRVYIEDQFGLHAPERTSEEFLDEMTRDGHLIPDHKKLVSGFLGHCDLVKFARYGPEGREMESAFQSAERLVHETSPREGEEESP